VVHDPLPAQPHFSDEGAANHVRLCAEQGAPGVNLMVWGRDAYAPWAGRYPARQTREAFEAVVRRHGAARAVLPRQSAVAIEAGAFHNDVVCVGTARCLLYHQDAFDDTEAMQAAVRAAAGDLFDPVFVEIAEADLSLREAVSSYLFNAQLLQLPGRDRLTLLAPMEAYETPAARAVADRLADSNGPIGEVDYIDLRESMRNGGGPACLRLRVVLTPQELAAAAPAYRLDGLLYKRLHDWICAHYRDRLAPNDLAAPEMIDESRTALEALDAILARPSVGRSA
jgi:succinylarginine dihydrolase